MNKQPTTRWRTWTARLAAIFCILFALAVASNASSGPYTVANPPTFKEQVGPNEKQEFTLDQLAKFLNLTGDQKTDLKAGCIGAAAALQNDSPVTKPNLGKDGLPDGTGTHIEVHWPELAAGTTQYATKALADDAASKAPAGSTVVEFQKKGGTADKKGNPTSVEGGPYDYTTVVNAGGTTYYVDANHDDVPAGSVIFYLTTTPPVDPTPEHPDPNNENYIASKWYVTIIPPKGGVPGPGSGSQR